MTKIDNPGVKIPPPLIYAAIFLIARGLNSLIPFQQKWLNTKPAHILGWVLIGLGFIFTVTSLSLFVRSKNTIIPIKPARSLQTGSVYALSRNPMYLSLLLAYCGLSFLIGDWWNFILIPVLIFIINSYVIRREEKYLERRFGNEFLAYKAKVRRWL